MTSEREALIAEAERALHAPTSIDLGDWAYRRLPVICRALRESEAERARLAERLGES